VGDGENRHDREGGQGVKRAEPGDDLEEVHCSGRVHSVPVERVRDGRVQVRDRFGPRHGKCERREDGRAGQAQYCQRAEVRGTAADGFFAHLGDLADNHTRPREVGAAWRRLAAVGAFR
jgi:hypothetical protein